MACLLDQASPGSLGRWRHGLAVGEHASAIGASLEDRSSQLADIDEGGEPLLIAA